MRQRSSDLASLWLWPFEVAQTVLAAANTVASAESVMAARMPMIKDAMLVPHRANRRELALMVSEKADAFGRSTRTLSDAGQALQAGVAASARTLGTLAGGGVVSPRNWFTLGERNLQLAAMLIALPRAALEPIQRVASANAGRLGGRRQT